MRTKWTQFCEQPTVFCSHAGHSLQLTDLFCVRLQHTESTSPPWRFASSVLPELDRDAGPTIKRSPRHEVCSSVGRIRRRLDQVGGALKSYSGDCPMRDE